jgi:hypothetical protein
MKKKEERFLSYIFAGEFLRVLGKTSVVYFNHYNFVSYNPMPIN